MAEPPPGVYVPSSFGLNQPAPKPEQNTPPPAYTGPTPGGASGYQETKVSPASTVTPEPVTPPRTVIPTRYPNVSVSDVTGPGLNISVEGRESTYQKDVITEIEPGEQPFIPSSVGIPHTNYIIIPSSFGLNQDYQSQVDAESRYWRDRTSVGLAQTPYSAASGAKVQQDSYYYYLTGERQPQIPILPSFGLRQPQYGMVTLSEGTDAPRFGDASVWDYFTRWPGSPQEQRFQNWLWEPSPGATGVRGRGGFLARDRKATGRG